MIISSVVMKLIGFNEFGVEFGSGWIEFSDVGLMSDFKRTRLSCQLKAGNF